MKNPPSIASIVEAIEIEEDVRIYFAVRPQAVLIAHILSSFDAEVWLMTSALKEKANYAPGDAEWLKAALPSEIAAMRSSWQRMFGTKQGAVRVKDSFSFVGVTT